MRRFGIKSSLHPINRVHKLSCYPLISYHSPHFLLGLKNHPISLRTIQSDIRHVQFPESLHCGQDDYINQFKPIQIKLLQESLKLVPEYGFTSTTISKASEKMGYPPTFEKVLPRGELDLILYFLEISRKEMRSQIEQNPEINERYLSLGVTGKIRTSCVVRLKLLAPYAHQWGPALSLMALPQNVPESLSNLAKLVDDMWYLAGDRSTDMNYYSKRAILSTVYSTTELFMSQDPSPEFQATFDFLNRRLDDSATFAKGMNEIKQMMNFGVQSLKGIINLK